MSVIPAEAIRAGLAHVQPRMATSSRALYAAWGKAAAEAKGDVAKFKNTMKTQGYHFGDELKKIPGILARLWSSFVLTLKRIFTPGKLHELLNLKPAGDATTFQNLGARLDQGVDAAGQHWTALRQSAGRRMGRLRQLRIVFVEEPTPARSGASAAATPTSA